MYSTRSSSTTLQCTSCYHRTASRYNPLLAHAVPLSCFCWAILVNTGYCPRSHQRNQVPGILKLTSISPQCIFLGQKMKAMCLDLLPKRKASTFCFCLGDPGKTHCKPSICTLHPASTAKYF